MRVSGTLNTVLFRFHFRAIVPLFMFRFFFLESHEFIRPFSALESVSVTIIPASVGSVDVGPASAEPVTAVSSPSGSFSTADLVLSGQARIKCPAFQKTSFYQRLQKPLKISIINTEMNSQPYRRIQSSTRHSHRTPSLLQGAA